MASSRVKSLTLVVKCLLEIDSRGCVKSDYRVRENLLPDTPPEAIAFDNS